MPVEPLVLALEAECRPRWLPTFGSQPGVNGDTHALTTFDDGSGPALIAAGDFASAGGQAANRIAKWDGASWDALTQGTSGSVHVLTIFDDGGGPDLHVGGAFVSAFDSGDSFLARWGCPSPSTIEKRVRRR